MGAITLLGGARQASWRQWHVPDMNHWFIITGTIVPVSEIATCPYPVEILQVGPRILPYVPQLQLSGTSVLWTLKERKKSFSTFSCSLTVDLQYKVTIDKLTGGKATVYLCAQCSYRWEDSVMSNSKGRIKFGAYIPY